MTTHTLKILPEFFDAVISGRKTFEVRQVRDFAEGDTVVLKEWDEEAGGRYTGRESTRRVGFVLQDHRFLPSRMCVFSLLPMDD